MSRPAIVLGDKTDHGGVVIQGSPTSEADGKPIARIGDKVSCPVRGHGSVGVIVSGDITLIIDGQPVARHGDKTSCGATLLAGQVVTFVDPKVDAAPRSSSSSGAIASNAAWPPGANGEGSPTTEDAFDQHFALVDDVTGHPLVNRLYRITWSGGMIEGRTSEAGLTRKVASATAETAKIEVFAAGV